MTTCNDVFQTPNGFWCYRIRKEVRGQNVNVFCHKDKDGLPFADEQAANAAKAAYKAGEDTLRGKVIVNFGDSIFGNFRPPEDISTFLAQKTGAVVYNAGFGGCRMAKHGRFWEAFSMFRLADAITTGDWSVQDDAIGNPEWDCEPFYFAEAVEMLKGIDFHKVDIITIAYASNDLTGQNLISDSADPYGLHTFEGALKYSIEKISAAFPHLNIVLCTPIYRYWWDDNKNFLYDSDEFAFIGQKLTDFVRNTKEVADQYNLYCIDNYYNSGICKATISESFPENDNTHPSETGRRMMADNMTKELSELFC